MKFWIIETDTVAQAWERLVIDIWEHGVTVPHYGKELTALVKVRYPFKEPRVHRGDMLCALKDSLSKYYTEVLEGTRDHLIGTESVHYTYHDRLFRYDPLGDTSLALARFFFNQIEHIIEILKSRPYYNGVQAITSRMGDWSLEHQPCLQRIWCKIYDGKLVMHTTWRSRDGFRAWHMNVLAMTELQKMRAGKVGVEVGTYVDFSNSVHIYKECWEEVKRWIETAKKKRRRW